MRYLPLTNSDRREMLADIEVDSVDELFRDVPENLLLKKPVALPLHKSELEVESCIEGFASKNLNTTHCPSFLGAGNYLHHIPASVDHLIQRGEFLTAYTPYQPEISQGTLQALFEFQTQVALITGMEVANASLYDGATSCSEATMMACRITQRNKIVVSNKLHPHYKDVTLTNAKYVSLDVQIAVAEGVEELKNFIDSETACVVVQNPNFFGDISDLSDLSKECHDMGSLLVVIVNEIFSLGLIQSPGEMGADIVAAEGQSLGNNLSFGGPHVGLLATREEFTRQMPGRLVGETVDVDGKRGWVLTLSTREQHIRREKATSNICTNSGLCALAFSIHLTLLGETGFTKTARINHAKALQLSKSLETIDGIEILNDTFFNEFTLELAKPAQKVVDKLAKKRILGGVPVSRLITDDKKVRNLLLVAATELTTDQDIEIFCNALNDEMLS